MARMKRLPSPDYFIKRLDRPLKRKVEDGPAVLAMFQRLAAKQGEG